MMNCQTALDQLNLSLDGRLDEAATIALKNHLACCEACRLQGISMAKVDELLARVGPIAAPTGLFAATLDKAIPDSSRKQHLRRQGSRRQWPGALSSLVAAGLGAVSIGLLWTDVIAANEDRTSATPALLTSLQTATGAPGIVAADMRRLQARPEGKLLTWIRTPSVPTQGEGR
jgi:anti-sigma factor RsiW